jgi:DHA2 family multidrug resistance protein-like MFS transporter
VAVFGTLATAVYRGDVEDALRSVPPAAAAAARESIDGAVTASGGLPAGQGADLLAAAREAFTSGVHAVGVVSAVLFACLSALAAATLGHVRDVHAPAERDDEVVAVHN